MIKESVVDLEAGEVRSGQVGRAPHQLAELSRDGVENFFRSIPSRHGLHFLHTYNMYVCIVCMYCMYALMSGALIGYWFDWGYMYI